MTPLVLRNEKGAPLTASEHDRNLVSLRDFSNALSSRVDAVLDATGRLKAGIVDTDSIKDRAVTQAKLAWDAQFFATAVGTNSYSVTIEPVEDFAYGDGADTTFVCIVKFPNANTAPGSLNVNGGGAIPIRKFGDQALDGGEIAEGSIHVLAYDGTNFQMVSCLSNGIDRTEHKLVSVAIIQTSTSMQTTEGSSEVIPSDGTVPDVSEGKLFMNFVGTPKRADTRILIEFDTVVGAPEGNTGLTVALFQDDIEPAVAGQSMFLLNGQNVPCRLCYDVPSWGKDIGATFQIKFGCNEAADQMEIGRYASTDNSLGGVMRSTVKITEYLV